MNPKSILIVSDFAFPVQAGTERLVFGLAEWLNKKYGIKADILTPNWNNLKEKETANGVTIHRFKTHDIKKTNPVKRIWDYVVAGLRLEKYDIYHGFYTVPPLVSAVALAKLRNAKSVITLFSAEQLEKNFGSQAKKFFILHALRKADHITAYTWKIEKQLREKYFPNQPTATTPGWVDIGFSKKTPIKKGKEKIILFVGRMTESKGVFVLLEAFAKIKDSTSARLVLIGPPYEKEKVDNVIRELGLENQADVLGFIPEKELNEWYNKCDVVAVPALHADAFGFSLMEAMACGKPVITTEGVGLKESEFGGIIVKQNDASELENALLKILTDSSFYEKCKNNAIKMVKLFDRETVMKKYMEVYTKVVQ